MRLRKLPSLVAICLSLSFCGCGGARTSSVGGSSSSSDKDGHSTHRQYSHSLDTGSSVSYGNKPVVASLASASAGTSGTYGSGESSRNSAVYDSSKGFSPQQAGSSVEYGGVAEGTGNFHSLFPASPSSGYPAPSVGYPAATGGYPSSSSSGISSSSSASASHNNIQGQHPPIDTSQPHGPAYTYYYQHYPGGSVGGSPSTGGWSGGVGGDTHEDGFGGDLGGLGGGAGGGAGGIAGVAAVKGIAILAKAAKAVLVIKPFLIIGLLFIIALPILLLFLPIPIITVTGTTAMTPAGGGGRSTSDPSILSYLGDLSTRVLTSEECLERFICKLPKAPEPYQKKAKGLWDSYGEMVVKNTRVNRGLGAYFDSTKEKNRAFKCNQRFQCTNKFI